MQLFTPTNTRPLSGKSYPERLSRISGWPARGGKPSLRPGWLAAAVCEVSSDPVAGPKRGLPPGLATRLSGSGFPGKTFWIGASY